MEVSDGATVVLTGKGEVMALHQYSVKKLGARQHGVEKIQVSCIKRATSTVSRVYGPVSMG